MTEVLNIPIIDHYESTLASAIKAADTAGDYIFVNDNLAATLTALNTFILTVISDVEENIEIDEIDTSVTPAKLRIKTRAVDLGNGVSGSATDHPATTTTVRISNNYVLFAAIKTAIASKLNQDGSNTTTTWDLQIGGSLFRIRLDGLGNMLFTDDNQSEVSLSTLAAAAGTDEKIKISVTDTTNGYLDSKLVPGSGISSTIKDPAANESLQIDVDLTDTDIFKDARTGNEARAVVTKASNGKIDKSFLDVLFDGDGSDGDINGALNITGSDNTLITKQYDSFAPGNNIVTITPKNCIVLIKVLGDCDLSDTTIDFAGKGKVGGAGGTGGVNNNDGNSGSDGNDALSNTSITQPSEGKAGAGGTGAGSSGGAGGSIDYSILSQYFQSKKVTELALGSSAGGGGGGRGGSSGTGGAGGAGGDGGGCIIFQVGGDVTLSSTNIDVSGVDGVDGAIGAVSPGQGGGGGGGGGGGMFVMLYNGSLTGSNTPDVSGGTGGAGGADIGFPGNGGGGGGGGGANSVGDGNNGASTTTGNTGGAGGNGPDGQYLIEENTTFT